MKNIPVYKHTAAYAREHDELAAYRASNQVNVACKEAIEAVIRDHYRDNRLDTAAVDQVVQQFGYDRAFHILAITVCQADWDRRYSPDNRVWANAMSIPANPDAWGTDRNCYLAVNSHPGLVDLFLSQTRKAYAQEQQKTSVRDMLKKLPETTSPKISAKFRSDDAVAKDQGISGDTVRRYIRLTNLVPELLDMVDEKKIAFNPAVELSYLDESQQRDFLEAMNDTQNAPSLSQAQRLKKLAQEGHFSYDVAFAVMGEEKKDELDKVVIKNDTLRKYFPRSYTPKQMEDTIIKLLEQWQRKQQRQNER